MNFTERKLEFVQGVIKTKQVTDWLETPNKSNLNTARQYSKQLSMDLRNIANINRFIEQQYRETFSILVKNKIYVRSFVRITAGKMWIWRVIIETQGCLLLDAAISMEGEAAVYTKQDIQEKVWTAMLNTYSGATPEHLPMLLDKGLIPLSFGQAFYCKPYLNCIEGKFAPSKEALRRAQKKYLRKL